MIPHICYAFFARALSVDVFAAGCALCFGSTAFFTRAVAFVLPAVAFVLPAVLAPAESLPAAPAAALAPFAPPAGLPPAAFAAAARARKPSTHPGRPRWGLSLYASDPAATSLVIVDPAAMYAS